jgi:hypothetical protein
LEVNALNKTAEVIIQEEKKRCLATQTVKNGSHFFIRAVRDKPLSLEQQSISFPKQSNVFCIIFLAFRSPPHHLNARSSICTSFKFQMKR